MNKKTITSVMRFVEDLEFAYDDVEQTITVRSLGGDNIFAVVSLGSSGISSLIHDVVLMRKKYHLGKSLEEAELSVRSYNCLKNANIRTIGELVQKTDADLLRIKNLGRKSYNGIRRMLSSMGLTLGMDLNWRVVDHPFFQPENLEKRDYWSGWDRN